MPEKRAAKKPAATKKAAAKPAAPKKAAAKSASPKAAPAPEPAKKASSPRGAAAPPPRGPVQRTRVVTAGADAPRTKTRVPVQKTRVVIPMSFYEAHKDEIKAPFKEHGMKWTFLGEGKGLYKRERDIHCFTQFQDDGVHYSIWGDDKKGVDEVLAAWRKIGGAAAFAAWTSAGVTAAKAEEEQKESEALKLWKLGEPQRRPGEPDFFFDKRVAEWQAKKPSA